LTVALVTILTTNCSNDDDNVNTGWVALPLNDGNLEEATSKTSSKTISITSSESYDYNNDGNASTDIKNQMAYCQFDDDFGFYVTTAGSKGYSYYFKTKCNSTEPNSIIREQYTIETDNVWLFNFKPDDTNTNAEEFVLRNVQLFSRTANKIYTLYRIEYDLLDKTTGKTFHWVREQSL
ncbi:MAG: hypothetical protein ACK5MD_08800, partial [Flavobacteriales bacterium]